jgi:hypothetical protein
MDLINFITEEYTKRVDELAKIYVEKGARASAAGSGKVFEHFIDDVASFIPEIKSIKNDYLKVECDEYKLNNVQVDRHIRDHITRVIKSVIEAKTYLDSCYCERAIIDFTKISESTEVSLETDFVIVTGQVDISKGAYDYCQAICKRHTGRNFKLFVINEIKKRNSKKPLYKEKFTLDQEEVKSFYEYLTSL